MKGSVGGGSSRHPAVEQPDKEQHLMETAPRWPLKLSPLDSWTKVHAICPYVNILF